MIENSPGDLGEKGAATGPTVVAPPAKRKPINGARKGKEFELRLVNYLKPFFPDARRTVRTGYRNTQTEAQDEGDIDGTPFLCFQMKAKKEALVPGVWLDRIHSETVVQAGPGRLPLIVNNKPGSGKPETWWLWMSAADYISVGTGMPSYLLRVQPHLVRVQLGDMIDALANYSRSREDKTG